MFTYFRQVWSSVRQPAWGNIILTKSFSSSVIYLSQGLLFSLIIPFVFGISLSTYYSPQLPKLLRDNLGNTQISLTSGQLSVVNLPSTVYKMPEFSIIYNSTQDTSVLDGLTSAVLFTPNKLIIKNSDNQTVSRDYSNLPDFRFFAPEVSNWIASHQLSVLSILYFAVFTLCLLAFISNWLTFIPVILAGAVLLLIAARFMHRKISFVHSLQLIIHALVPCIFVSFFGVVFIGSSLELVCLAVILYLTLTWLREIKN